MGDGPLRQEVSGGDHANVTSYIDPATGKKVGGSFGGGLARNDNSALAYGGVNVGSWNNGGGVTNGFEVTGGLFRTRGEPHLSSGYPMQTGMEASALDGSAGVTWNSSTAQAGAGFNVVSGGIAHQTLDPTSGNDRGMRFGMSAGPSLAGRVHYGDADRDGRKEYGLGFDLGPFSFDYKTERPVGDAACLLAGPLAPILLSANAGMDWLGMGEYAPGSLIEKAGSAAWDTLTDPRFEPGMVADSLSGAVDGLGSLAGSAIDGVGSALGLLP